MSKEQLVDDHDQKIDPELLVKIFKYHKQFMNKTAMFYVDFKFVPTKSYYKEHKKYFDKLSFICEKYKIDPEKYIKFCITELGIREGDRLINVDNLIRYANNEKILKQYESIYKYYIKSANYVADECFKRNITPKDFIKELITTKRLAYEYIAGNLSMYFIASLKNIDKLCLYLDQNSRDELSIIINTHKKLNQDVQETFIKYKNQRVSPISLSETILKNKLNKSRKN